MIRAHIDAMTAAAVGLALLGGFLIAGVGDLPFMLDEGNHLAAASRILDGGTLGLDTNYPKLGAYVSAAWLGVFGRTLVAARVYVALVCAAIGVLLFLLVRRRAGQPAGVAAVLLFGCWSVPHWPVHSGDWTGVLFMLLALLALLRHVERGRARSLVAAGACIGLTGCFFPDLALFSLLAGAAALAVIRSGTGGGVMAVLWRLGLMLAGLVAVVVPLAIALFAAGALERLIYLTVTGPLRDWKQFDEMYLPYPTSLSGGGPFAYYGAFAAVRLVFVLPVLAAAAAVYLSLVREGAERWSGRAVLIGAAVASLLTLYPRSDLGHLVLALPLALPLLAEGGSVLADALRRRLAGVAGRVPGVLLLLGAMFFSALGLAEAGTHTDGDWREPRGIAALAGFPLRTDAALELEALDGLLRSWTEPGEPVFAYPDFAMFYFLFPQHPPPVRFLDQTFGWFDDAVLEEVVTELERKRVRVAVRRDLTRPVDGRPLSEYASRLTGYLDANYREVARIGRLTVLYRR